MRSDPDCSGVEKIDRIAQPKRTRKFHSLHDTEIELVGVSTGGGAGGSPPARSSSSPVWFPEDHSQEGHQPEVGLVIAKQQPTSQASDLRAIMAESLIPNTEEL